MMEPTRTTVCIAEDEPTSRRMLEFALFRWGYHVAAANDGLEAFDILSKPDAPKLAILDWTMPGMNGHEVCKRLRQISVSEPTYIILLTAKGDKKFVVEGLEAGADDFIVKPYHPDELHARLRVGEKIVNLQKVLASTNQELARYASEMEDLAQAKAKQLIHSDKMATLGVLAAGVAHEINNPVAFISGNMQILESYWPTLESTLASLDPAAHPKVPELLREIPKINQSVMSGVNRIKKIVGNLKRYSRKEKGETSSININSCVEQSLEICQNRLKYSVSIVKSLAPGLPAIMGDAQQVEQVLVNLLVNAADAIENHKGSGTISITTMASEGNVVILVQDDGPGFTPAVASALFEPFFTTKSAGKGTGLGLSISKGIIEEHGGTIKAGNRAGGGAEFIITFPQTVPAHSLN